MLKIIENLLQKTNLFKQKNIEIEKLNNALNDLNIEVKNKNLEIESYKQNFLELSGYKNKYYEINHLCQDYQYKFNEANHVVKATELAYKFAYPGHFYSPFVDLNDLKLTPNKYWRKFTKDFPNINFDYNSAVNLLHYFEEYYNQLDFTENKNENKLYYYNNFAFSYGDGIILNFMITKFRPKRIIEIGSGFSSCMIVDTINKLKLDTSVTFIEPYPELLKDLVGSNITGGKFELISKPVQEVDKHYFESLTCGDILFIDSSHVAKPAGDVNHIYFEILPLLKKGVIVHVHDIFGNFDYPIDWILEGRAWNEAYLIKAFLMFNNSFKIIFFNSLIFNFEEKFVKDRMPLIAKNPGGSLWLEVI